MLTLTREQVSRWLGHWDVAMLVAVSAGIIGCIGVQLWPTPTAEFVINEGKLIPLAERASVDPPPRTATLAANRLPKKKALPPMSVSLNTATAGELEQLPGIGPVMAARIVAYRKANGPFASIDALDNVSGIGPKKLEKMAPFLKI